VAAIARNVRSMERALRNHNVWLTVLYVGLILLLSRTYA
jgi:hypothetical protein